MMDVDVKYKPKVSLFDILIQSNPGPCMNTSPPTTSTVVPANDVASKPPFFMAHKYKAEISLLAVKPSTELRPLLSA